MIIDLHMHSTVSDGTDTPEEILRRVKAAGIGLFSLTDHDAVKGAAAICGMRTEEDPLFLPGVEFSCRDEEGKYHILGYGFDPDAEAIRRVVERSHELRMEKIGNRIRGLAEEFGFIFPKEMIDRLLSLDNPGKPHIGNLMVRLGYARTKEEAIEKYINRLHIPKHNARPEEVISEILSGGGVPVLAHPVFGSGNDRITGADLDRRVQRLMGYGLKGVEAYYSRFTDSMRGEVLAIAGRYGLYVTAGSDYHGTNKPVGLGQTGLGDSAEAPEGLMRFLEAVHIPV
ncbi:MAG: PHP domain-containing protein [Lachnospiraceae bacterium]|nr:PHP domain-containing protein [Lachnospiraceae bacterium]